MRSIKQNKGFTLIEILIAMIIMAFGLLGLAGLQASGLKQNNDAHFRSQATTFAYDLADRIRANSGEIGTYIAASGGAGTANANCLTTTGCTTFLMAAHDISEWKSQVNSLPGGSGSMVQTAGTATASDSSDDVFTIIINWDDDKDPATADTSFTLSFAL